MIEENKKTINVVPIDGGDGPVEPNNESIESGEYAPLSRPLFTYVKNSAVKEQEEVYDFVKFMLENAAELSEDVGYVKLPEDQYTKQLEILETLK
ncbi:MAG: phosphate-binding protein [Neobacillus sp.]|nr:phosphate-binding protein [Neobacillus sp.]